MGIRRGKIQETGKDNFQQKRWGKTTEQVDKGMEEVKGVEGPWGAGREEREGGRSNAI